MGQQTFIPIAYLSCFITPALPLQPLTPSPLSSQFCHHRHSTFHPSLTLYHLTLSLFTTAIHVHTRSESLPLLIVRATATRVRTLSRRTLSTLFVHPLFTLPSPLYPHAQLAKLQIMERSVAVRVGSSSKDIDVRESEAPSVVHTLPSSTVFSAIGAMFSLESLHNMHNLESCYLSAW